MEIHIRPMSDEDVFVLPYLEWSSDQLLRSYGMSEIADQPMNPPDHYRSQAENGQVWIATIPRDDPSSTAGNKKPEQDPLPIGDLKDSVAFVSVKIFGDDVDVQAEASTSTRSGYVVQLSVHNQYTRRGIGSALMQHAEAWARHTELQYIYLTTYANVPFNRPFYERLGYRVLSADELNQPDARPVRHHLEEERRNKLLGKWERVAMRKPLVD